MLRLATFSRCGQFRYRLSRRWTEGAPLLYIMLNPSMAEAEQDDPAIKRCIRFAQAHDFPAVEVVNLFAYRATDLEELWRAGYPVGTENDEHIAAALREAGALCVAWGAQAHRQARIDAVLALIKATPLEPQCLDLTLSGQPHHPLTARRESRLHAYAVG